MMKKTLFSRTSYRPFIKLVSLILTLAITLTACFVANSITVSSVNESSDQTFTLNTSDGVTITLSGVLPVNGRAEAEPADPDGDDVLHAYDITIFRQDGTEFEPSGGEPVAVSFKSEAIERAIADEDTSLTVGHIDDSGKETEVALTSAEGNEAQFVAESFSIYVIYAHEEDDVLHNALKTFYFLSDHFMDYEDDEEELHEESSSGLYESGLYRFPNEAGEMVSTQTVKNNERLHSIVMPNNSEYGSFNGWYVVELDFDKSVEATIAHSGGTIPEGTALTPEQLTHFVYSWGEDPQHVTADTPIEVGQTDENVYLAPLFYNFRFVEFMEPDDDSGAPDVATRKIIALSATHSAHVELSDVVAESLHENEVFYGWKYNDRVFQTRLSTGDVVEQYLTLTDDDFTGDSNIIELTPIFKKTDWIAFDTQANDAVPVASMLAFLYDPTVPEQDRATISQLPSTTRPGYIFDGWYAHYTDTNGQPVQQQVSMEKQNPTDTSNSAVIPTGGNRIRLDTDPDGSYLFLGKLYLRHAMTLYAHWRPVNSADYKVVIWKQKVTDSKNASNSEKHYDYSSYKLMEDAVTGSVVLDLPAYQAENFEGKTFDGFHYSRTEVVVDSVAYAQGDQSGIVAPDGSTVVNVYYDRDLMTIQFKYSGTHWVYTQSSGGDYIQVNGEYFSIESTNSIVESGGTIYLPVDLLRFRRRALHRHHIYVRFYQ